MASLTPLEDADLLMDDFLLQEIDTFTLPLLELSPQLMPLSPAQHTPLLTSSSQLLASPMNTDDGSTDAEASSPPSVVKDSPLVDIDTTSSPAATDSFTFSSMTMHEPVTNGQELLVPRIHHTRNSNVSSLTSQTSTNANNSTHSFGKMLSIPSHALFTGLLPYATPVAYLPPSLNVNQKRPFLHVLPGGTLPKECESTASTAISTAKKSKREIRQMKNRESANKSRLRRKAQLTTLTTEVIDLRKKQQELLTTIACLRAENKSLTDQNTFLRSLLTSCKQEPTPTRKDSSLATFTSLPTLNDQSSVALNLLESGQNTEMDNTTQDADSDITAPRPNKWRVTSSLSTSSLAVCASVFGITIFADYESVAVDSSTIRSVGRVLHGAPTSCCIERCSSEASMSTIAVTAIRSWWPLLSSSELLFGVLLNVVSFIAIMVLFRLWHLNSWNWGGWIRQFLATLNFERPAKQKGTNKEN